MASDLPLRSLSAVAMLAVAGAALYVGGAVFAAFVALVAAAAVYEWWLIAQAMAASVWGRIAVFLAGVLYIGAGAGAIVLLNDVSEPGKVLIIAVIGVVIATDVGAYFSGRAFGGPKIAPSISPSKTWAGLFGGMLLAGLFLPAWVSLSAAPATDRWLPILAIVGAFLAIVAQAGDFLESWAKRRAGIKDSGRLIPGHGGILDRVDGLIPVAIAAYLLLVLQMLGLGI